MKIILTSSKTMNYKQAPSWVEPTKPKFLDEAHTLVTALRSVPSLQKTLEVSDKIAELNADRLKDWQGKLVAKTAQPAGWAYSGDGFNGLSVQELTEADVEFAKNKLFVASGLYGLVRLTDAIEPYRLEMNTKLKGDWGKDLYKFWGEKLGSSLSDGEWVLNCTSVQYGDAALSGLDQKVKVITPVFLHDGEDGPKQKALFSKYARGLISRWAIQNRIKKSDDITKFDLEGYTYNAKLSSDNEPVFIAPKEFSLLGRFTKS